ncbi:cation-transporting P-type ATPase [Anditalea andensis]|uniref:Carbonate dehydratase n=1 Tax=Anditalea andensis TaxID=1048983 RepID=A0A074KWJ8_9BACT|nr:cation-transporting P-type ATPase [Anditalea andensis]KEO71978.1 carbonate dehydratase [Anditalea andensis]
MKEILTKDWHHLEVNEIEKIFETDSSEGIGKEEADKRIGQFGENKITKQQQQSSFMRFLLQFHQPLIYILLGATIVTLFLGEYIDAGVIFAVVLLNAIIGFVQESKALSAIDSLSKSMTTQAVVVRNGDRIKIEASALVPGDLVLLESGDRVPADLRLTRIKDLRIDESALTGESVAVDKKQDLLEKETVLGDRTNMAYASTVVTYGRGSGIVIATGDKSEIGKISGHISSAQDIKTPLTVKIEKFSHQLLFVILGLTVLTFAIGLLRGQEFTEIFMSSVAFAVSVIPEGLPAAVTIMLALGVSKMAKRRAIIRKLVAVETLGSTTVICSDKTGTLTENQMTVQRIYAGDQLYKVTGIGYAPEGEIQTEGNKIKLADHQVLNECLQCGLLCNDSKIKKEEEKWKLEGDPTEAAIYVASIKGGLDADNIHKDYPRLEDIPFESEYQYMATLHKVADHTIAYIKGSMEALLERSDKRLMGSDKEEEINPAKIEEAAKKMSSDGLRVLGFGSIIFDSGKEQISHDDLKHGVTFLGLQGMIDPPRDEAKTSVHLCQKAGIQVKMITGDHALTASAIAGMIGLEGEKEENGKLKAYTGRELSDISDEEYPDIAERIAVFARVAPEQKLKLVKALQSKNNVVAMTGDGVNDGPALKQANIGVAMGITGTEVAKDASDMVLTDDNFASIESAVEEGRGVFDNLTKFIVCILPTNLGQGLSIMASIILGMVLPILPVQALWVNMTTAVLLGLPLAFEPNEPDIMDRKPRNPDQPIMTKSLVLRTLLVGFLILLFATGLFHYELYLGADKDYARTVTTTTIVVIQAFYLLNCRSLLKTNMEIGFFSNPWIFGGIGLMMVFQVLFIYVPIMNVFFHTLPLNLMTWLRILAAGALVYIIISIEKYFRRKYKNKNGERNK